MRCIKLLIIPLLLISLSLSAQKRPMVSQEIIDYDYLSHKYEKLDENFKIHISHDEFQNLMKKYGFHPQRIRAYKDSLSVVLMGEFDSWKQARMAENRLLFTDLRSSYYLWTSPDIVNEMRFRYGFDHPYRFYEYYRYNEDQWDEKMHRFMKELRKKVAKVSDKPNVLSMTSRDLLREALILSPQRVIDFKEKANKRLKRHHDRR